MITTTFDPEADALYVRLDAPGTHVHETREVEPGILLDYSADGALIGIEVLGVSKRNPVVAEQASIAVPDHVSAA